MTDIASLKSILSAEEHVQFVRYLKDRNRRSEARNIELFQSIGSQKEKSLKVEMGSNAYNVLANRLKKRLIDFIATRMLETESSLENQLTKYYLTARKLLKYNHSKLSFKLLLQAEVEATDAHFYSLVNDIHHTLIEHSHLPFSPTLDEIQQRSNAINKAQQEQMRLNFAYARIKKTYQSIEYQGEGIDLSQILKNTYFELGITEIAGFSFSALHKLVQLADIHGAYTKNYNEVNLLFIDKLRALQSTDADNEKNSHYHIEILYSLAHIYFRKKQFDESLRFLNEMETHMQRFQENFHHQHAIQAAMLRSLNLNHLGEWEEAMKIIQDILSQSFAAEEIIQIRLALAMIQFQQGELRACQQTLTRFSRTDAWYERKLGVEWTLHKLTMEILLHIELENYDYAESRLSSMLRKYAAFFKNEDTLQAKPFLLLVHEIIRHPQTVHSEEFKQKVASKIEWKTYEEEDVFRMNFYAWLRAKMNRGEVYSELLELFKLK